MFGVGRQVFDVGLLVSVLEDLQVTALQRHDGPMLAFRQLHARQADHFEHGRLDAAGCAALLGVLRGVLAHPVQRVGFYFPGGLQGPDAFGLIPLIQGNVDLAVVHLAADAKLVAAAHIVGIGQLKREVFPDHTQAIRGVVGIGFGPKGLALFLRSLINGVAIGLRP